MLSKPREQDYILKNTFYDLYESAELSGGKYTQDLKNMISDYSERLEHINLPQVDPQTKELFKEIFVIPEVSVEGVKDSLKNIKN